MIEKFDKILCGIVWIIWLATILWCSVLTHENKELRKALNEPVNCEAVCESVFEHMGC